VAINAVALAPETAPRSAADVEQRGVRRRQGRERPAQRRDPA